MARLVRRRTQRLPRIKPRSPWRRILPQLVKAGLLVALVFGAIFLFGQREGSSRFREFPTPPPQPMGAFEQKEIQQRQAKGDSRPTPTAKPEPVEGRDMLTGVARVIDGDTLEVAGVKVRLFGIDAPEEDQPCSVGQAIVACGELATMELRRLVGAGEIRCEVRDTDRYGRLVSVCTSAGKDVGAEMVASGWATAYTRYSRDYVEQERAAKSANLGLWQGAFENPEQWRHRDPQG